MKQEMTEKGWSNTVCERQLLVACDILKKCAQTHMKKID